MERGVVARLQAQLSFNSVADFSLHEVTHARVRGDRLVANGKDRGHHLEAVSGVGIAV